MEVTRGVLGTQAGVHTVGAGITALSGDYRIDKGKIHFTTPPYGKSGIHSTSSSFRGRIFYRLDYTDNILLMIYLILLLEVQINLHYKVMEQIFL